MRSFIVAAAMLGGLGASLYWYALGGGDLFVSGVLSKATARQAETIAVRSAERAQEEPVAQPASPPPSQDDSYRGKIAGLPDAARAVLEFTPAENSYQTNSHSLLERVAEGCGFTDYVGSGEFPGKIWVSSPKPLGWVGVSWKPGQCKGIGGSEYPRPTLSFEISADRTHIKYLGGSNGATYWLTH